LLAEVSLLWALLGCAGRAPTQTDSVSVVRAEPDRGQAWAVLEDGAGSLEVPSRRRALDLLIALSEPADSVTWGARGLWDPSPHVQRTVTAALQARLPEPDSLAALQAFVQRDGVDSYTRCAAASGLARSGDTATIPAVRSALDDAFEPWRAAPCALALAEMADGEAATAARAQLSEILASGELPLELGFVDDLGRSALPGLGGELVAVLDILEPELQLAVATAVLRLGEDDGEEWFRRALSDDDIELQLEAIDFLLTLPPQAASDLLRRAGGPVKMTAQLALIELGEGGPEDAVTSLLALDREVRAEATRAIGGWLSMHREDGPRRMVRFCQDALIEALQDPEDMVRLQALRALARVGRAEDAEVIAPLLQADALLIRIEAAGALLALTPATTSG
jgi:HEAT repeat protein